MHQEGLDHVLRAHPADEGMRDLLRLAAGDVIDPQIVGRGRPVVVVEQPRAIGAEGGMAARRLIHAFRHRKRSRFTASEIVEVDIFVAVYVGGPGDVLAVRGKFAAADFPLVFGEPAYFLRCDICESRRSHIHCRRSK